jgi:hypothetical protein
MDKHALVVSQEDYPATTFTNNRTNQRHGIKGINGSHCTTLDRRTSKGDERCPFTCSIFLDSAGYYLKTATNSFLHQFYARRDHILTSSTLLHAEENQILCGLSSARAKTGVAANLHYVQSGCQDTKSILVSHPQIKALLKKNPHQEDGNDADKGADNLYQFLEKSGSHYVSLLARVVPEASEAAIADSPSTADSPCQTTHSDPPIEQFYLTKLCLVPTKDRRMLSLLLMKNKTCFAWFQTIHGYYPSQTPRKRWYALHMQCLTRCGNSNIFNVCLHIDATADSNKEGQPALR